jgi:hypothetical protein
MPNPLAIVQYIYKFNGAEFVRLVVPLWFGHLAASLVGGAMTGKREAT